AAGADVERRMDVGAHLVGAMQRGERGDRAELALLLGDDLAAVEHAREEQGKLAGQPLVEPLPGLEPRAALQGAEQLLARLLREGFEPRFLHQSHTISPLPSYPSPSPA